MSKSLTEMTDDELRALEESLYDMEAEQGVDVWFERDLVLQEMRYRGMMKGKPVEQPQAR